MSEMLFGLVNSNCVRVLETVAGCPCCKCQMISLCCRYSCCLWLLTCPATNDPNPCHMLCRLPLPLPLTTATTTRATLTQFQLQSCGPAQATSVRLFNEISKHCKCVQLSKCCTHPSPPTPLPTAPPPAVAALIASPLWGHATKRAAVTIQSQSKWA